MIASGIERNASQLAKVGEEATSGWISIGGIPTRIEQELGVSFRLIYEGELLSHSTSDRNAFRRNKHAIRKRLHPQLKQLWATDRKLKWIASLPAAGIPFSTEIPPVPTIVSIAKKYERCGNGFVPLIPGPEERPSSLYVSLDILFLRREPPGAVVKGGDIDNRLKTFFDALEMPEDCQDVTEAFSEDEKPMYCFFAPKDDQLISEVKVTTDLLLEPAKGTTQHDLNHVMLLLHISVSHYGEMWR